MAEHRPLPIDATMLELFHAELEQQTAVLVSGMLALEKGEPQAALLDNLMRAAHSLKGAARLLKITSIEKIAHVMEDKFVAAQKGVLHIDAGHVDVLLSAIDTMQKIGGGDPDLLLDWHQRHSEDFTQLLAGLAAIGGKAAAPKSKGGKKSAVAGDAPADTAADAGAAPAFDKPDAVRVSGARIDSLIGKSSELLIQHRWLHGFVNDMIQMKKRFSEVNNLIESLREIAGRSFDPEAINAQLRQISKRLRDNNQQFNHSIGTVYEFYHRTDSLLETINQEILSTRMRPFAERLSRFPRMVRDISRSLRKNVSLRIEGGNTEVDRDVLDKIETPLNHLLRNAIDHGVETPAVRRRHGKPEEASIVIAASYRSGMLHISISDDGAGIDLEAIRRKVINRGLAPAAVVAELSTPELLEFIFLPTFSTKEKISELSGRGVGLDVVKDTVTALKGSIKVDTVAGQGTRFELQMPVTVSVVTALIFVVDDEPYALPLARVEHVGKLPRRDMYFLDGRQYFRDGEDSINVVSARQVLQRAGAALDSEEIPVVILKDYLRRYALVVDSVLGQKDLVMQPLDPRLGKVQDVAACAILENGMPVLILDVDDLTRSMDYLLKGGDVRHVSLGEDPKARRRHILLVDDSATVREVVRNLLAARGYRVSVAVDGIDAWNSLRSGDFDLLITDIDMPRMDGIQLISLVRGDPRLHDLPVMIVSYKDRSEDRRKGLQVGADYYLTKGSFQDETLIEAVRDLIGEDITK